MGGKAFTTNPSPLSTPRMPPDIYYMLRDYYLQLLSSLYTHAATPIEAPRKTSYGDIDVLVALPKSTPISAYSLSKILEAERIFAVCGSPTTSFALPYPNLPNNYVQLDVHLCSFSSFHWQLFHQSHGDLWNLLGTTIRPFGLTPNDAGLHVRIGEIEDLNRKRALLFLTCDPDAVLKFLGLDTDVYKPFESVESMYRYVCRCRYFKEEIYVRSELKANDRKRMAKRELYRAFVDWLPHNAHLVGQQKEKNIRLSRDGVLEESLNRFGKREEYEKRLEEWRKEREELLAKQEGRQKRKADAAELEEYASAWMRWLDCNI
ncbi:MAG: hypothetical protein ALECFALPRED_008076 [Alectoria fallacina]|uniref:Uncharacterized protein n=1 Tax=Alectoria fallacina TaxID=1903189 RepID=A0A8H3PFN3_9LECA|nr:MAG: hypothetical protein ALECFALPRED_008076 [Alectoria fallacina]